MRMALLLPREDVGHLLVEIARLVDRRQVSARPGRDGRTAWHSSSRARPAIMASSCVSCSVSKRASELTHLDFDVDDVYWSVEVATTREQVCRISARRSRSRTIAHRVKAALLAGDHNLGHAAPLLELLRRRLELPIPIEHGEHAVGRVSERIS